jgi:hypothetical protein
MTDSKNYNDHENINFFDKLYNLFKEWYFSINILLILLENFWLLTLFYKILTF